MLIEDLQVISSKPMLLGECPLWHPLECVLYWIDIAQHAIHRFDPSSHCQTSWNLPSEPGCIAWHHAGGLIVTMRSGIARFNTDTGQLSDFVKPPYDSKAFRFNDGRCDAAGRLWVGTLVDARDKPDGRLYRYTQGQLTEFDYPVMVSNGIAFSPDASAMYHADTSAHRILIYDFDCVSGTPGNGRLLKTFSSDKSHNYGGRPDGAAVDSEGAYWIAMYEGAKLLRLSPDGDVLDSIKLPFKCPTMMAFGGTDLKTLFITSASQKCSPAEITAYPLSGFVISIKLSIAGRQEYAFQG